MYPVGVSSERHCQPSSPTVCVTDLMVLHYRTDHVFIFVPSARHGDGLYDSYMRTDHILKDDADTNSPSGLPPMPKHTVSTHTNTHMHKASKAVFPVLKHALSPDILFLREIFPTQPCSRSLLFSVLFGGREGLSLVLPLMSNLCNSVFLPFNENSM